MTEQPNLNYIEELSAGSPEFKQKLIEILKREFPEEKKVFLDNYSQKKYKATAENVHKLKHKVGMLGFEAGYQTTISFEEELLNGEDSLFSEFMLILDSIENFLVTI
ncbi:Hpt domain-containing protein [Aquimarina litoralis]|uniref:Hpt domain-containing protein n=1 Tax=Aquimarina litoralis TaxID=584605 RepID=UPI001C598D1F|nr:Hpt domain-containing protein [Aquimarina litoralis]MBW1297946.1 Hpt domain-containing protein [Aquimarina litoralis]